MTALLFGSIGTLADTSELQRQSFNEAFAAHDLNWNWSRDDYRALLTSSGGAQRIADYAKQQGDDVDAAAVHATKSEIFQRKLTEDGVPARAGVVETIAEAQRDGDAIALVTTTSAANVAALTKALAPEVDLGGFALVVSTDDVDTPKPAPDAYRFALERLGEDAAACVAIEDNVGGVQAATAAGLTCVAFPNENTVDHDFDQADRTVQSLAYGDLRPLAA